jgi:beta-glucanase (GH16 family)
MLHSIGSMASLRQRMPLSRGWRLLILLTILSMLLVSFMALNPRTPAAQAQTWNLVWSDDFNSFNSANWTYEVGGGGWGNSEREYYTNGANTSFANGIMTIQARRVTSGYSCWYGTCEWTSTRMITKGKKSWQYGRVEARMQIPMGAGLWPAFWMLGSNIDSVGWPLSGEIDIMEHINTETNTHGYIHWDSGGHAQYGGPSPAQSPGNWHTYMIEWTPSYIRWYLDGVSFREANILNSVNSTEEFHRPFFIILNLAVGGAWPGMWNSTTPNPANLNIDYVRVYQQGGTTPPPPTAVPPTPGGGGGATGISSTTWYSIQNVGNSKCVDVAGAGTANGTRVQQWGCVIVNQQQFLLVPTDSGYYRIMARHAQQQSVEIGGGSGATGNGAKTQIWGYVGGTNQQWKPESMGTGVWRFRARHSNRCLDVPSGAATDGLQLQQWDCNSSNAQNWRLIAR